MALRPLRSCSFSVAKYSGLLRVLLARDDLLPSLRVPVEEILEHLDHGRRALAAGLVRRERRRRLALLDEAVLPAQRRDRLLQRGDDLVVVRLGDDEGLVLLL